MSAEHARPGTTDNKAAKLRAKELQEAIARQLAEKTAGKTPAKAIDSEERANLDRLLTALRKKKRFSGYTITAVNENPAIIEDFHATQERIFHGSDPRVEMTGFWGRHPVTETNRRTFSDLAPAFDFIAGRFRQDINERNINLYQRAIRSLRIPRPSTGK